MGLIIQQLPKVENYLAICIACSLYRVILQLAVCKAYQNCEGDSQLYSIYMAVSTILYKVTVKLYKVWHQPEMPCLLCKVLMTWIKSFKSSVCTTLVMCSDHNKNAVVIMVAMLLDQITQPTFICIVSLSPWIDWTYLRGGLTE